MAILLDTNILLRLVQPQSPHVPIAERALSALRARNEELQIVSQNLVEFWKVVTRLTTENGLGLSIEQAKAQLFDLKRFFILLPEVPLQSEWEQLVERYRVSGKNSHDARLVAAMSVHGTNTILTFNTQDFVRYTSIAALDPRMVA